MACRGAPFLVCWREGEVKVKVASSGVKQLGRTCSTKPGFVSLPVGSAGLEAVVEHCSTTELGFFWLGSGAPAGI